MAVDRHAVRHHGPRLCRLAGAARRLAPPSGSGEKVWRRLVGVHPHTLRHSCGFALADRGHDLRLIQDYLGHRDPRHTVHYSRTSGRRFEGLWGR